jgi:hypothetical protein
MHVADPFALPGQWFKGCLHVHSTISDGKLTPQEVHDWYRSRGYHFLALTDHDVLSRSEVIADDFIILSGIEVEGIDPAAGLYHLVALGLEEPPDLGGGTALSMQETVDWLCAAGALVSIAHPYWSCQMSRDLMAVENCFALEIYNGGCEVDDARGFSTVHWDDLLSNGRRLWGLAVDDAHWRRGDHDAGLGWVWIKAPALTQESVLQALRQGAFYASSGPQIYDLQLDPARGEVYVHCSPAVSIDFVGYGWYSRRMAAPPGGALTEASHRVRSVQRYVRVACRDAHDRWAWSNPIFVDAGDWPS